MGTPFAEHLRAWSRHALGGHHALALLSVGSGGVTSIDSGPRLGVQSWPFYLLALLALSLPRPPVNWEK